MIIRVYNNDGSDYCDYEGTVEEIKAMCAERIRLTPWVMSGLRQKNIKLLEEF